MCQIDDADMKLELEQILSYEVAIRTNFSSENNRKKKTCTK